MIDADELPVVNDYLHDHFYFSVGTVKANYTVIVDREGCIISRAQRLRVVARRGAFARQLLPELACEPGGGALHRLYTRRGRAGDLQACFGYRLAGVRACVIGWSVVRSRAEAFPRWSCPFPWPVG